MMCVVTGKAFTALKSLDVEFMSSVIEVKDAPTTFVSGRVLHKKHFFLFYPKKDQINNFLSTKTSESFFKRASSLEYPVYESRMKVGIFHCIVVGL